MKKLFKWLFRKKLRNMTKPIGDCDVFPALQEILTLEQINNAFEWYDKHFVHVNKIIKGVSIIPPSQIEDKNDPSIWKPEYWNWFLNCNR